MKKALFLALLLPLVSFGQKFEVREQAGYSIAADNLNDILNSDNRIKGFSNRVDLGYSFTKNLSAHAFYEYDKWNTHSYTFGVSPEYAFGHFYVGADLKLIKFRDYYADWAAADIRYKESLGYGFHIGSRQKLFKGLSLTEELGYGKITVKGSEYFPYGNPYAQPYYIQSAPTTETFTGHVQYGYLRAGLSYRF